MKKILTALVVVSALCSASLFAQASSCPDAKAPECKPCPREVRQQKKVQRPRRQFKMSPEMQAERKQFRDAVAAYKKDPSADNKAKLMELLGKRFDRNIERQLKHAAALRSSADRIAKKAEALKADRNAELEKMLQQTLNPQPPRKRQPRKMAPAPRKAAPAAPAAPAK